MFRKAVCVSGFVACFLMRSIAGAQTRPATQPAPAVFVQGSGTFSGEAGQYPPGYFPQPRYFAGNPQFSGPFNSAPIDPQNIVQDASCVIQIEADVDVMNGYNGYNSAARFDNQTAAGLLTSTALRDAAIARLPDLKLESRAQQVHVMAYPSGVGFVRIQVILTKNGDDYPADAAQKLIGGLCDSLKSAFEASKSATNNANQARLGAAQKQVDDAKARLADVRSKLSQSRQASANVNGNMYGDVENTLNNLLNQKRNADSELARAKARLAGLDPGTGPLATELEQVVKLRQQRLDEITQSRKDNKASDGDVADAELKLADAKTQLAAARTSNPDPNQPYRNNELTSTRAQVTDADARAKAIEDQIDHLNDPKIRDLLDQMPELQQQENMIRNELTEVTNRLDQLRRSARSSGALTITVLDGQPGKG